MKIILVVGARPNFMKIAPIIEQLKISNKKYGNVFKYILLHTGQHYDEGMSKVFFKNLGLPKPDIYLGIGSASQAVQTAKIMVAFEKACSREKPDLVLVVGDVNSTLACSLVAAKLGIKVAHVEAGLRSFDRSMPEEINRLITDSVSDLLFTTCKNANENLRREGIDKEKIFFVGNVMVDTLLRHRKKAKMSKMLEKFRLKKWSLANKHIFSDYAVMTLHRPSNVDNREAFKGILNALKTVSRRIPVIFPVHPRTKKQIKSFGFQEYFNYINLKTTNTRVKNSVNLLDPLSYLDFLDLMANAKFVLTDSGGIQEETTVLGIPCLTLRKNTERPVTIEEGTNILVGINPKKILTESLKIIDGKTKKAKRIPMLWDGKAAQRIVNILLKNR